MKDEVRRMTMFTSGVAELTRNRAEQVVKELVKNGDVRREQATSTVRDLLTASKQSRGEFLNVVRSEIRNYIMNLGVASARDVQRLERRVARLEAASGTSKKTTAKRTTSRSSTTRKTTASKSPSVKPAGSDDSAS